MQKDDLVRLRHMLDAARETLSFSSGKSRTALNSNRMLVLSLVKGIEIIGEAAGKVSQETKKMSEEIPWQDIIDMRNHLTHAYFDVDLNIVWDTILRDLPPLVEALEKIIPSVE